MILGSNSTRGGQVRIIAEVGSNYDGNLETARSYIRSACQAGADAVKFQTLRKELLIAPRVRTREGWTTHPAWEAFVNQELPAEWHGLIKEECDKCGVEFISTPFHLEAVKLLEDIGVQTYKIASGDITFIPLLEVIGATGKQAILSTGASSLEEVKEATQVLQRSGAAKVTVLHCVASYPPRFDEMNLRAMVTIEEKLGFEVGLSDHSPDELCAIAAVSLGASVIEKHVTFDRQAKGPDHAFAITFDEFSKMVVRIRQLEKALGNGKKQPTIDELKRRHRFRRGIYDTQKKQPTNGSNGLWLRPEHNRIF